MVVKTLLLLLTFLISFSIATTLRPPPEVKEVWRLIPVYQERIVEVPVLLRPDASKEELFRAFLAIEYGRWSHNYYINHPENQNENTGDTDWNLIWVENYDLIGDLLRRAYLSASSGTN